MIRVLNAESIGYDAEARDILTSFAEVTDADLDQDGLVGALGEVDVVIVRLRNRVDARVLAAGAPHLRAVVTATTGLDHIDLQAASAHGVEVLSLQGETDFLRTVAATAEHTWALLLALVRRLPAATAAVADGADVTDRDRFRGRELRDATLGLVGVGRIGAIVAQYGRAFGMEVLGHDPHLDAMPPGVVAVDDLDELCRRADMVSVHVPLDDSTAGLVTRSALEALGPDGLLVNTSRGAVVDEDALCDLLEADRLGGAALDVVTDERSRDDRRLTHLAATRQNVLITPHIGGATHESMARTERFMADKLRRWIKEHPQGG